jgi:hypothetical protein
VMVGTTLDVTVTEPLLPSPVVSGSKRTRRLQD